MPKFVVSALNVVMPTPHGPERYVSLLREVMTMKQPVNLRNDFQGMLGSMRLEDDGNVVVGELYRYFNLRMDAQWFNMLEQKPAEEADLSKVSVPEHLKPHFKIFPYAFFPKHHRFFLISREAKDSMTPGQAQKLLKGLFSPERIFQTYGAMEVHVEPARENLESILSIPHLKRLHVEVTPPNPDDFHAAELALFGDMHDQNAGRLTQTWVARTPKGLSPSQATKSLAAIAQSNGHVEGKGEDVDGKLVQVSTLDHPLLEDVSYRPVTESRVEILKTKAAEMLGRILQRPAA